MKANELPSLTGLTSDENFTVESEARALEVVRDNLTRVLDGEEPSNVVNGVKLGARLRR